MLPVTEFFQIYTPDLPLFSSNIADFSIFQKALEYNFTGVIRQTNITSNVLHSLNKFQ